MAAVGTRVLRRQVASLHDIRDPAGPRIPRPEVARATRGDCSGRGRRLAVGSALGFGPDSCDESVASEGVDSWGESAESALGSLPVWEPGGRGFGWGIAALVGAVTLVNATFWQVVINQRLGVPDAWLPFFPMVRSLLSVLPSAGWNTASSIVLPVRRRTAKVRVSASAPSATQISAIHENNPTIHKYKFIIIGDTSDVFMRLSPHASSNCWRYIINVYCRFDCA